jgi:hypothetical protein
MSYVSYLSQLVVFVLALVGTFFRCVRQDEQGHTQHNRFGLPIPTTAGKIIVLFLTLSFLLSIATNWSNYADAKEKEAHEKESKRQLETDLQELIHQNRSLSEELTGVRGDNADLQDALNEVASTNLKNFELVLSEQSSKHRENLNRFSYLLRRQEDFARATGEGINQVMNPLPTELVVSFTIQVKTKQDALTAYVERITRRRARFLVFSFRLRDLSLPHPTSAEEREARAFFSSISIQAKFYKEPVTADAYGTAKEDLSIAFRTGIARPNPAEESETQANVPTASYNPFGKLITLKGTKICEFVTAGPNITSLLHFRGSTVLIRVGPGSSKIGFELGSIVFRTPTGRRLPVARLKRYDTAGSGPIFYTTIPKDAIF